MNHDRKEEIDHLIAIYLAGISSISMDAGWPGDSILSRLIEFQGQIPPSTGNDQSNLSMIIAIEKLRDSHFDLPKIKAAMIRVLKTKPEQAIAICAKSFFQGMVMQEDRAYRDEDRARMIEQDLNSYRYNLKNAYHTLSEELERIEEFVRQICVA